MLTPIISAIEYYVPEKILSNYMLAEEFPEWGVDKIYHKTGIKERRIVIDNECASDLGYKAATKLFNTGVCHPRDVQFLILCTQSPDYFLPSTACILQNRLNIPITAGALDFNLGCSGYIYGLSLAKGLLDSNQVTNVLLITADTYSKFIEKKNKSVRTIFGDGAAATFLEKKNIEMGEGISSITFGTDGSGANNLIVAEGLRNQQVNNSKYNLFMNGSEIFSFSIKVVPKLVHDTLLKANLKIDEIDMYIFHQANRYMLNHLKKKIKIPTEKFYESLEYTGNTVSSTIPIALKNAVNEGCVKPGNKVMLVGFGVGYSWGALIIQIA